MFKFTQWAATSPLWKAQALLSPELPSPPVSFLIKCSHFALRNGSDYRSQGYYSQEIVSSATASLVCFPISVRVSERQIHRTIEKLRLERTSGDHLVRPSFENRALYYPEPCQAEQTFPCSPWRGPWWTRLLSCRPCKTTSEHIHAVQPMERTFVFLTTLLYF